MASAAQAKGKTAASRDAGAPGAAYRRVPNFNLLPGRSEAKALTSLGSRSLMVLLVGALALGFLLFRQGTSQSEMASLGAQLQTIQTQLAAANAQKAEAEKLLKEIERLERGGADYGTFAPFTAWSAFLSAVQAQSASAGVTLSLVKQKSDGAVLSGFAQGPAQALAFYKAVTQIRDVDEGASRLTSLSKSQTDSRFTFTLDVALKSEARK